MSYKIVFFDIDGTLVNEEKVIPNDTVEAIRELKASGVEPVIATGRAPYFIKPLAEQLGIESYVCLNGGYVVYKGQPLYKREIEKSSLEALVGLAGELNHSLVFEGEHFYNSNKEVDPSMTEAILTLKVDEPSYNPEFWQTDDIFQVFLHCESHEEHLYESLKSHFTFIRWHDKAMDVLPLGGSKAQGIEALLKKLEYTADDAVAFGDGLNDKEMLDYVGFGVAMGNSHPELLPFANYVTTHVDEKGIRNGLIKAGLLAL
ncbi:Cof-type HAD-IIB family hydrolase [Paenibacillus sp. GSMTC-2017]|uniref:Cof-type HAD-IIB family hydrolase n=1 Tax=Paenibacillus sp. GSMTC-2017 TaxID=2794350 RepID=UPI0018D614FB|nr:Cof-type HAD-IIB family hydrolase [Paenibacillus sp. GSMTC-2017]MBH5318629.1 Cof-type HAD-IIB family hydrolase [Paenibacillus sp. GSMTC-2017]